jgi:hypothetical protein
VLRRDKKLAILATKHPNQEELEMHQSTSQTSIQVMETTQNIQQHCEVEAIVKEIT